MKMPFLSYEERNKLQYKQMVVLQNVSAGIFDVSHALMSENIKHMQFTKDQISEFKAYLLSGQTEYSNIQLIDIDSWSEKELEQLSAMSERIRERYQSAEKITELPMFFQISLYRLLMKQFGTNERCADCFMQSVCDVRRNLNPLKKSIEISEQNCLFHQWRIFMSAVLQFDILIKKPVTHLSAAEILTLSAIAFMQEQKVNFG